MNQRFSEPKMGKSVTLQKWLLSCVLVMSVAGSALAQAGPGTASVTVDVDVSHPLPKIDRNLFGQFSEHLGSGIYEGIWVGEDSEIPNIHGYRKDVVEALKKIHVPVLRWPGGCFADQYDWRDGIGPRDKRPVRLNSSWGGALDNNAFGTHEFLDFAELIGAEPYISINMGSMAPLDAARWLEYMTSDSKSSLAEERRKNGRDKPWKIKYVGVGNEVWGCGGTMRAEYAIDVTRRYATYIRDPSPDFMKQDLVKVASGPTANDVGYEQFADTMMKNVVKDFFGNYDFQALSLHYYAYPLPIGDDDVPLPLNIKNVPRMTRAFGFSENEWASYLRSARAIERPIRNVAAVMDKYDPEKKIALYVDEWGAFHQAEPGTQAIFQYQQSSLLDAEVAALTLNVFQRHTDRVRMANVAQMVNVVQALILTDKQKMLLTPTYHIFDMYQPFQDATPYPVSTTGAHYDYDGRSLPAVDVVAAKGTDGKIYLALVNLDPHRSVDVATNLKDKAHGTVLTGNRMDVHNTFEAPNTIHPVPFSGTTDRSGKLMLRLPAKSIVVVAVE
jgi:alpha-L-arabinofuranosidase